MVAEQWWWKDGFAVYGPFSRKEISELIVRNEVRRWHELRRDGNDWEPAVEQVELACDHEVATCWKETQIQD